MPRYRLRRSARIVSAIRRLTLRRKTAWVYVGGTGPSSPPFLGGWTNYADQLARQNGPSILNRTP